MKKGLNSYLFSAPYFMADGCPLVFHQMKAPVNDAESLSGLISDIDLAGL
jgi:hypothetical protein